MYMNFPVYKRPEPVCCTRCTAERRVLRADTGCTCGQIRGWSAGLDPVQILRLGYLLLVEIEITSSAAKQIQNI